LRHAIEFGLSWDTLELGFNGIFFGMFHKTRKVGNTWGYIGIRMDVRISRIAPMGTDFFEIHAWNPKKIKKSVPIGAIREIRTSICIATYPKVEPKNETSHLIPKKSH
jgi:hypothetical protein